MERDETLVDGFTTLKGGSVEISRRFGGEASLVSLIDLNSRAPHGVVLLTANNDGEVFLFVRFKP